MPSLFLFVKNPAGENSQKVDYVNIHELIRQFQFCPICRVKLLRNPYYGQAHVVYCPEHGDFFVELGTGGLAKNVVFRPHNVYYEIRENRAKSKLGVPVRCNQTGIIYSSIKKAAAEYGISRGNLWQHLHGNPKYTHVNGLTFSLVEDSNPSENPS